MLKDLQHAITTHRGTFLCEALGDASLTRTIAFRHEVEPAMAGHELPDIPGLRAFYATFDSVLFYADAGSGDAAILIAAPAQWGELRDGFDGWTEHMDAEEREEYLPEWEASALVIGEEPQTGNYLLMPTTGEEAGRVFLFDHDGFEFIEQAPDLPRYAHSLLDPDDTALRMIASHMRFIEADGGTQWWIRELHDNRGNTARTGD